MSIDIRKKIIKDSLDYIVETFNVSEKDLFSDKDMNLIGLSSLDIISLIIHLEELYNVQIPSDISGSIKSIEDIASLITDVIDTTSVRDKQISEAVNLIFNTEEV